jgi:uncharacterized protein YbjT (DUF2867 family)
MSPVLVTGGSGYVGTQLIAALLRAGSPVRATVRSTGFRHSQVARTVAPDGPGCGRRPGLLR